MRKLRIDGVGIVRWFDADTHDALTNADGHIKAAAENLAALAALNGGAMWMQGTDSTAMPGVSYAKVEAWTTYPEASNIGKKLAEDSAKLAAVAGDGLDALRGGIGAVGKSCGACHEGFRIKKE